MPAPNPNIDKNASGIDAGPAPVVPPTLGSEGAASGGGAGKGAGNGAAGLGAAGDKGAKKAPYRGGHTRFNRRRTHHEDAHSDPASHAEPDQGPTGLAHPLIFHGKPELITTQERLLALLERLRVAGAFVYDTEFIGESNYNPKLCLVQIATSTEVALVDPLSSEIDLRPFWALLCDERVEKVVHAGQQDIEPVVRLTGDRARNIFDTQIAAGFVRLTYPVALSKLAMELLGVKLGKSMTFTQWDARPLSATQLRYAADDVRYLPALREVLGGLLAESGHVERVRAECEALCEPTQYIFDPNTYIYRVRGSGSLTANQMRILRELVVWRDGAARAADSPPRAYLKDEVLVDLCRSPVKSLDKLGKIRGMPRPVEQEHGHELLDAVQRGLNAPPVPGVETEKSDEPTPRIKFCADAIWSAAQTLCHAHGIDPMMGASRQEIGKLVYAELSGRAAPTDLRLLQGWRRDLLGEPLRRLIHTGGDLRVSWKDGMPTVGG